MRIVRNEGEVKFLLESVEDMKCLKDDALYSLRKEFDINYNEYIDIVIRDEGLIIEEALSQVGFDIEVQYDLGYHQGEGARIVGSWSTIDMSPEEVKEILENYGMSSDLIENVAELIDTIRGHNIYVNTEINEYGYCYCHSRTVDWEVECEDENDKECDDSLLRDVKTLLEYVTAAVETHMKDLFNELDKDESFVKFLIDSEIAIEERFIDERCFKKIIVPGEAIKRVEQKYIKYVLNDQELKEFEEKIEKGEVDCNDFDVIEEVEDEVVDCELVFEDLKVEDEEGKEMMKKIIERSANE